MTGKWAQRALVVLMAITIVLSAAVSFAYVQRAQDRNRIDTQNSAALRDRSRERTAQLAFFCHQHNGLVDAVTKIVNPPGAVQVPERVRALQLLAMTHCDPKQFHLSP